MIKNVNFVNDIEAEFRSPNFQANFNFKTGVFSTAGAQVAVTV